MIWMRAQAEHSGPTLAHNLYTSLRSRVPPRLCESLYDASDIIG
jgi:hypothetical protein